MHKRNYIHRDIKPENIGFLKGTIEKEEKKKRKERAAEEITSLKILNFLTIKKVVDNE